MHYYEVAPQKIIRASSPTFTYASHTPLAVGQIVSVEAGKKHVFGIVISEVKKPTFATKEVTKTIEAAPLPHPLVLLAQWMSTYYDTHLATVLQTILPRGLGKKRRKADPILHATANRTTILLNKDQLDTLERIQTMTPGTALLHGVTGSGKTNIYIESARRAIEHGRSVILLVPEIALTPQLVNEFSNHFDNVVLAHSRQTEAQRHVAWQRVLANSKPLVVIGPRSALFLPLKNIGLIVIDEAHEPSYKQEKSPRYSALRAASVLASYHQAKLILGSATPNIADYYLAEQSGRPVITIASRAQQNAMPPTVTVVDMTKRKASDRHRFLSNTLLTQLATTLEQGHQALIFHNRRGSANVSLCETCGWSAICPRCHTPMSLHADTHKLVCHICTYQTKVPTHCPACGAVEIIHKGVGTKLIESELKKIYPDTTIARFDGDNTTNDSLDTQYQRLVRGDIDIIIGTQIVAKGLDLPHLRTVGIIQADTGLNLPDFFASERTFQLLTQAIGRVGRNAHDTSVVVQTYQPNHYAITNGITQNYTQFYQEALQERRHNSFPPFSFLLKLTCTYKTEAAAISNARKLANDLRRTTTSPSIQILGPAPAFYERQHDTYRWQLLIKAPQRSDLMQILQFVPKSYWQIELDPISLL